jgi:hypothetical protein
VQHDKKDKFNKVIDYLGKFFDTQIFSFKLLRKKYVKYLAIKNCQQLFLEKCLLFL